MKSQKSMMHTQTLAGVGASEKEDSEVMNSLVSNRWLEKRSIRQAKGMMKNWMKAKLDAEMRMQKIDAKNEVENEAEFDLKNDVKNKVENEVKTAIGVLAETSKTEDSTVAVTTKVAEAVKAKMQAKAKAQAMADADEEAIVAVAATAVEAANLELSPMEEYLKEHYHFRYNLITEQTEYRSLKPASSEVKPLYGASSEAESSFGAALEAYLPLDVRASNSLFIELDKNHIDCTEHALLRYLRSSYIEPYHPFQLYLRNLPAWDQHDRLVDLASRVSTDGYWIHAFHRWMLALTAQWLGIEHRHANSTAPLLISTEQGMMKSTFCRSLMPKVLSDYYTDQMDISQNIQERKLAVMGLINLDEFDRLSSRHMAQLKNLMQLSALNLKKAYKQHYQQLPRIASFIGTSNRKDLLTDPTGSRRFICVEVKQPIDCSHIDHDQIYAQLLHELSQGSRYWFSHDEETEIQLHNTAFYRASPEEELFQAHFRAPSSEETGELLSLNDIFNTLMSHHKGLMRNLNLNRFGNVLVASGVERIHTRYGNKYCVVRRASSNG